MKPSRPFWVLIFFLLSAFTSGALRWFLFSDAVLFIFVCALADECNDLSKSLNNPFRRTDSRGLEQRKEAQQKLERLTGATLLTAIGFLGCSLGAIVSFAVQMANGRI